MSMAKPKHDSMNEVVQSWKFADKKLWRFCVHFICFISFVFANQNEPTSYKSKWERDISQNALVLIHHERKCVSLTGIS